MTLFCFTFLHSLTEAEDMALDAFAVVAMKRSTWYGGSFQRWLYRIARNLSISRFRKLRLPQVPFDEAQHLSESSVEAIYWRQEQTEALRALLFRLPQDERSVLTRLYLEDMSYAQAAEALGMDEKRVDNLAYRGKRRLREWLKEEGRDRE